MNNKLPVTYKLKHQIIFLKNIVKNDLDDEQWQKQCTTYAEITPIYGSKGAVFDNISFGALITEELFIFTTRYITGLHSKLRIQFEDRYFQIKRIVNLEERNRFLQIIALEISKSK